MKYIKRTIDGKTVTLKVSNDFVLTQEQIDLGFSFTTKSFYKRVVKANEKNKIVSGKTKKGSLVITRGVFPEHLKYGNQFTKVNGKLQRVAAI